MARLLICDLFNIFGISNKEVAFYFPFCMFIFKHTVSLIHFRTMLPKRERQSALTALTTRSRNLVLIWLEDPVGFLPQSILLETWYGLERWNESREMHKTTLSSRRSNGGERGRRRRPLTSLPPPLPSDKKWTVYVAVGWLRCGLMNRVRRMALMTSMKSSVAAIAI